MAEITSGGGKTLDLNNPPKVPYAYQEYPRMVYGPEGARKIVNSDDEKDAALEAGFVLSPDLVVEKAAEEVAVDNDEEAKPRKGRKG